MKSVLEENKKRTIRSLVVSVFYAFRQATKALFPGNWERAANLDPFYIGGIFGFFDSLKKHQKRLLLLLPLAFYVVLQLLFIEDVDTIRMTINVIKILLCVFVMFYVKDKWKRFSIYRIVKFSTILIFISSLVGLIFRKSTFLWRLNDVVNDYDRIRMHGLFFEPSELGFHVMILMIFLVAFFFVSKVKKERGEILLLFAMNMLTLILAKSFGAIVIGAAAIALLITIYVFQNITRGKLIIYFTAVGICIIGAVLAFAVKNPIAMRLIDTMNGSDASNYYRIEVSLNVMTKSLDQTDGLGVGFGNLHTAEFKEKYSSLGLASVVANSFQYFIIEAGVFAIISLVLLWIWIIKEVKKKPSALKIALLVFLFLYQIFGGHFTSGLTWALYGLCVSMFTEHDEMKFIEKGGMG